MVPYTYASAPSSSAMSTRRSRLGWPSVATLNASGRIPSVTDDRPAAAAAEATSRRSGTTRPPSLAPPSTRGTVLRFIAGDPMNPATNEFPGRSYRTRGVSTCCRIPSLSTATRCPIVIASIWSCVT